MSTAGAIVIPEEADGQLIAPTPGELMIKVANYPSFSIFRFFKVGSNWKAYLYKNQ